jgi:short-subunit dehydrogenase
VHHIACSQYVASKAGLLAFSSVVFADVRDFGVKVSTILPGIVNTELGRKPGPIERAGKATALMAGEAMIQSEDIADAGECALIAVDTCGRCACRAVDGRDAVLVAV